MLGAGLSGVVLFTPIWPVIRHHAAKSSAIVMIIIVSLHLLLAVGFMLYFFHVPGDLNHGPQNVTEVVNSVDVTKQNVEASTEMSNTDEKRHEPDNTINEVGDDGDGGDGGKSQEDKAVEHSEDDKADSKHNQEEDTEKASKLVQDSKAEDEESKPEKVAEKEETEN